MAHFGIQAMVVDGRALELVETTAISSLADDWVFSFQISPDGRYVAYLSGETDRPMLRVSRTSGRRSVKVIGVAGGSADQTLTGHDWVPTTNLVWSPDSSQFYVEALRGLPPAEHEMTMPDKTRAEESRILFVTRQGKIRASLRTPDNWSLGTAAWSPDGSKLAMEGLYYHSGEAGAEDTLGPNDDWTCGRQALLIVDTLRATYTELHSPPELGEVVGWTERGDAVKCFTYEDDGVRCWKRLLSIPLDGSPLEVLDEHYDEQRAYLTSQAGTWIADDPHDSDTPGVNVEPCSSIGGGPVTVVKDGCFVSWTPLDSVLIYCTRLDTRDDSGLRRRRLSPVWLASVEAHKLNHMLIALHQSSGTPICSADCTRIAYSSDGRLYTAKLRWRDADPFEKALLGLPLGEEDEKALILDRAWHIYGSLQNYVYGHAGSYPSASAFREALTPVLLKRWGHAFEHPTTGTDIFHCYTQKQGGDSAGWLVGVLDAGYSWQVNIYRDSPVAVVDKQQPQGEE